MKNNAILKNTNHKKKHFQPLSRQDELALLRSDDNDFSKTKTYLRGLILDALDLFEFSSVVRRQLRAQLLHDVTIAAKRFLAREDRGKGEFKFSTYFGWYIAQRINPLDPKRKPKKETAR